MTGQGLQFVKVESEQHHIRRNSEFKINDILYLNKKYGDEQSN